mmetsp:Transcript_30366/g.60995  ORF Transcript_30366/g.60995 Transcript_30366/m.60995 type:complete len:203 (-) Transcript_30366:176-784(-)
MRASPARCLVTSLSLMLMGRTGESSGASCMNDSSLSSRSSAEGRIECRPSSIPEGIWKASTEEYASRHLCRHATLLCVVPLERSCQRRETSPRMDPLYDPSACTLLLLPLLPAPHPEDEPPAASPKGGLAELRSGAFICSEVRFISFSSFLRPRSFDEPSRRAMNAPTDFRRLLATSEVRLEGSTSFDLTLSKLSEGSVKET